MIAIEKIYCSYSVSKLLKEKGFDEPCYNWYNSNKELRQTDLKLNNKDLLKSESEYLCPTHEQVIIWLKENHNIWIYCYPSNWKEYGEWEGGACWIDENVSVIFNNSSHSLYANEPEEVIEMVLLYVLRNII